LEFVFIIKGVVCENFYNQFKGSGLMNELTKHAFLLEINLQCEFVSYATQGMETALNQEYEVDGGAFWF
ncbi:hypothetical protein CMV37_08510, partial [Bacillus cereus]